MKNYIQSPLPFQGQKIRFLRQFKEALKPIINSENLVVVDLFGGSGLLSHTVKVMNTNVRVIWNDYDNYKQRLGNVEKTNALLADLRLILANCPIDQRIVPEKKIEVINRIKNENGYIDYITISASLLFSGKYATAIKDLEKDTLYNKVKKTDYVVDGYLDGVERVQSDYKDLFLSTKDHKNVVYLIDPPYLSTDCKSYSSDNYWKLKDYLNVLTTLQNTQYFYFTSNKSQIVELCEWISTYSNFENPFKDCEYQTTAGNVNYSSSYVDIMCYKFKSMHLNPL